MNKPLCERCRNECWSRAKSKQNGDLLCPTCVTAEVDKPNRRELYAAWQRYRDSFRSTRH